MMECIKEVEVRAAEACDMHMVHTMIQVNELNNHLNRNHSARNVYMSQELACFENMPSGPKLCVDDLIRDGAFNSCGSSHPKFNCFVAEAVYHDCVRLVLVY